MRKNYLKKKYTDLKYEGMNPENRGDEYMQRKSGYHYPG
jgi:hypothetical protein